MNIQNKLRIRINSEGNRVCWSAAGLPLKNNETADLWRLHLDDGFRREMMAKSSQQSGSVAYNANETTIRYPSLKGEDGRKFQVAVTLHILEHASSLEFWADIENHEDIRVNEAQFPFIDLTVIGDEKRENDVLYRPHGLGERMENPWSGLDASHTEYMASDYNEIWSPMVYPRPCSMAWYGIESAGHFMYVGRQDEKFRLCTLLSGIAPRNAAPRLISAVANYPFAMKGETISCAHTVVTLCEGNWQIGSDLYGAWAHSTWCKPRKRPDWVQNMTGWQRIILKHQFGEIFWKYADLPRLYQEGTAYGLDTLLVFGWWKGRFDNGYPLYEPDPDLGGAEALKAAIAEVQAMGGRVILYTNGVLIDRVTDYYKEIGHKICRIDIDGNEYQEHYQFANNGTVLRNFGYKTFVSACQGTPEWRDRLLHNGRVKLRFNPDSIFYDQIGGHKCWPCFNNKHAHGNRADQDPLDRRENLKAMLGLCTGDKALGSENTVDIFSSVVDYNHGCDYGNWYRTDKNTFPAMYRRTFPETIMTNRFIHDCRPDFQDELNFAFINGYRFDVSIYRGRVAGIAGEPCYGDHIKKLIDLREKYHRFFYHGTFVTDTTVKVPDGIRMAEYAYEGERMLALWNEGKGSADFALDGNPVHLDAGGVTCIIKR